MFKATVKKIYKTATVNIKTILPVYFISGTVLAFFLAMTIVTFATKGAGAGLAFSIGDALCLLPVLAAIFIPARNFKKTMNLGGKRIQFLMGSIATYAVFAAGAALVSVILHYSLDVFTSDYVNTMASFINLFGWATHGPVVAFLRYFAFLTFFASVVHCLVSLQDCWVGWLLDVLIIAVISVFTPIAPLRSVLIGFFDLTIFNSNAVLHIFVCLSLAAVFYASNIIVVNKKAV